MVKVPKTNMTEHLSSHTPDYSDFVDDNDMARIPTDEEFQRIADQRIAREAIEKQEYAAKLKQWHDRQKREIWKGRIKKVLAATAMFATVKSGGFFDIAADPFSEAGDVAKSAIAIAEPGPYEEIDGVEWSDLDTEQQSEYFEDERSRVDHENQSRSTVIGLFERADSEGYQEIITEVNADKAAHPELFASSETAQRTKDAIESAPNSQDAIALLNEFMSNEYGIKAGFYNDEAFDEKSDELREVLKAYINVFSPLPKDFIAMSQVSRLNVSREGVTDIDGAGTEGGSYSSDGSIDIVVGSKLMKSAMAFENLLDGDDYSYEALIGHELGHAFDEQGIGYAELDDKDQIEMSSDGIDASAIFGSYGLNQIKRPKFMSPYGRTSSEENTAEVLSGVLSDRSNGLAKTYETRAFGSGAGKAMIDMLAQLESARPGIAKLLIVNRIT